MSNLNTVSWKEFKVGDLFTQLRGKEASPNRVPDGKLPMINEISINNGLSKYGDSKYVLPGNAITVSVNYATTVFYQKDCFIASVNIIALYNSNLDENNALFIVSLLRKLHKKYDYNNKISKDRLNDESLYLPVKENGTPNWAYMAERIKELEAERIKELEAYLLATGLDDYELTEDDKQVLAEKPQWKEFGLGNLFVADKGNVDLQQKDINGKGCYFINSGVENFGIKGKTDKIAKVFPANSITIDFWGYACYRDFEYKLATHNHVFSLVGNVIKNREVGLFLVSRMKAFPKAFSYNNMATWNKLKEMTVSLPVKKDGSLDLDYMERYIRAIEKLVIADAVKWKDKVIETTKAIVA